MNYVSGKVCKSITGVFWWGNVKGYLVMQLSSVLWRNQVKYNFTLFLSMWTVAG